MENKLDYRTMCVAEMAATLMSTNPTMPVKVAVRVANAILEETLNPTKEEPVGRSND